MTGYQPSQRMRELREQDSQAWTLRLRIERRYAGLKSFSPAMRKHFAERDIQAAMVAAGLPLPVRLSFDELVQRHVHWERRSPGHIKAIRDMPLRRAVIAALSEVAI